MRVALFVFIIRRNPFFSRQQPVREVWWARGRRGEGREGQLQTDGRTDGKGKGREGKGREGKGRGGKGRGGKGRGGKGREGKGSDGTGRYPATHRIVDIRLSDDCQLDSQDSKSLFLLSHTELRVASWLVGWLDGMGGMGTGWARDIPSGGNAGGFFVSVCHLWATARETVGVGGLHPGGLGKYDMYYGYLLNVHTCVASRWWVGIKTGRQWRHVLRLPSKRRLTVQFRRGCGCRLGDNRLCIASLVDAVYRYR
ncbi:hypothetical protein BZA05DRAFT_86834 [Tricharina praecox]|uniref:uncharacterized protein n=1 Tax=Tricharina praecox TaxID=43433 RepID=UPI00221F0857|nr:uncharacterized protein BZA05DRAFT_86834 [Tricharina praecox]KAI5849249.1 hypothetical protein BZA05DRAFT_86834 [Tricharina praecox]